MNIWDAGLTATDATVRRDGGIRNQVVPMHLMCRIVEYGFRQCERTVSKRHRRECMPRYGKTANMIGGVCIKY